MDRNTQLRRGAATLPGPAFAPGAVATEASFPHDARGGYLAIVRVPTAPSRTGLLGRGSAPRG